MGAAGGEGGGNNLSQHSAAAAGCSPEGSHLTQYTQLLVASYASFSGHAVMLLNHRHTAEKHSSELTARYTRIKGLQENNNNLQSLKKHTMANCCIMSPVNARTSKHIFWDQIFFWDFDSFPLTLYITPGSLILTHWHIHTQISHRLLISFMSKVAGIFFTFLLKIS